MIPSFTKFPTILHNYPKLYAFQKKREYSQQITKIHLLERRNKNKRLIVNKSYKILKQLPFPT